MICYMQQSIQIIALRITFPSPQKSKFFDLLDIAEEDLIEETMVGK